MDLVSLKDTVAQKANSMLQVLLCVKEGLPHKTKPTVHHSVEVKWQCGNGKVQLYIMAK